MNLRRKYGLSSIFLALTLLALNSCSLKQAERQVTVSFELGGEGAGGANLAQSTRVISGIAPLSTSAFNCYAINVIARDIPASNFRPGQNIDVNGIVGNYLQATPPSYCSYPGRISAPIILGASGTITATIQVPTGVDRVIQVVGIVDPTGTACSSSLSTDVPKEIYLLGKGVIGSLNQNSNIAITKDYPTGDTAALSLVRGRRRMDCGFASNAGSPGATFTQTVAEGASKTINLGVSDPEGDLVSCTVSKVTGTGVSVTESGCSCTAGTACAFIASAAALAYCGSDTNVITATITDQAGNQFTKTVSVEVENTGRTACRVSNTAGDGMTDAISDISVVPDVSQTGKEKVFFRAMHTDGNTRLYKIGSDMVKNALDKTNLDPGHDAPENVVSLSGKYFFLSKYSATTRQLYSYDDNTTPVKLTAFTPGADAVSNSLIKSSDKLYFLVSSASSLYSYDGTSFSSSVTFSGATTIANIGNLVIGGGGTNTHYSYDGATAQPIPGLSTAAVKIGFYDLASNPKSIYAVKSGGVSNNIYIAKTNGTGITANFSNLTGGYTATVISEILPTSTGELFFTGTASGNTKLFYYKTGASAIQVNSTNTTAGADDDPQSLIENAGYLYYFSKNTSSLYSIYRINLTTLTAPIEVVSNVGTHVGSSNNLNILKISGGRIYFSSGSSLVAQRIYSINLDALPIGNFTATVASATEMGVTNSNSSNPFATPSGASNFFVFLNKLFFTSSNAAGGAILKLFHY